MVEVHSMRTTPLPSPGEAKDPVASHHSNSNSAQSTPTHADSHNMPDRNVISDSSLWPMNPSPSYSHEHDCTADSVPAITAVNDPSTTSSTPGDNVFSSNGHTNDDHGRSLQIVHELRRQMEGILASQHASQNQKQQPLPTGNEKFSRKSMKPMFPDDVASKIRIPSSIPPLSTPFTTGTSLPTANSTGSDATVTGAGTEESFHHFAGQSTSLHTPRMQSQTAADVPLDNASQNLHFDPRTPPHRAKEQMVSFHLPDGRQTFEAKNQGYFLPPEDRCVPDDPNYSSPNLYDLTLKLNADPGLCAWWSNLVNILQAHYGAERASIAVPGDSTDLENVPWGQKAVFNQGFSSRRDSIYSRGSREFKQRNASTNAVKDDEVTNMPASTTTSRFKRPSLFSRHSFAGFGNNAKHAAPTRDPSGLQRPANPNYDYATNGDGSGATVSGNSVDTRFDEQGPELLADSRPGIRQAVFPLPRPLEVETDPLIKRIGVVKLFGRTKPVVLTREYLSDQTGPSWSNGQGVIQTPNDKVQNTPSTTPRVPELPHLPPRSTRTRSLSNPSAPIYQPQKHIPTSMEIYEEYEQVLPSPWSQSPAPSPAPRAHAEQNPFFTTHTVDETAFSMNPPPHDYSKVEPLEAIGVDGAKSVVHIPLLHVRATREMSPQTLRFPIAVLSILSPVVPYPANLRQSLAHLMPHLTTSFCLAQQYSQLERQVSSQVDNSRYGQLLGLGGTFSGECSELELVAGLSGHVSNTLADDATPSPNISLLSPGERSALPKFNSVFPRLGTPGPTINDSVPGMPHGQIYSPTSATKHGNDATDSYFNVKRSRSFRDSTDSSRKKQNVSSVPSSPGCLWENSNEISPPQNSSGHGMTSQPRENNPVSPVMSSAHGSSHTSTNSLRTQLHRDLQRPFPDTIAQLMLNSVPLHLFLAKPQCGEVIWTNAKFDAYRRSRPQEQRSRDPWQNVHSMEHANISAKWQTALRTGSQFTERVRVKRFNDETSYRWFIFRANPLLSATGEVLYWIGSFLDVHEQHVSELKAAQEREKFAINAKYRAFSNSIPQVVFEAAEFRGLIFANDQWRLYSGQPIEEALNLGFAKHVHPDDLGKCSLSALSGSDSADALVASEFSESCGESRKRKASSPDRQVPNGVTPALDELLRRGVFSVQKDENGRVFYSTEIRLRSKGGDFRWHLVRIVRAETISFGNGEASWYGTCTDINDRKLLEKELNRAMQRLNREMESKTKFFSNMSHEIRTPLNGIMGTIPFILDTQIDADQRRMLDTIQNSSTNLRELVDNILDVSRVEAGKMSLVISWFHVRSVIEDVIDTIASRALDKGLELNYLMDADVPGMVMGDRFRIRQVLINLVGNAVKFTSRGEIYISCSIHHDRSASLKNSQTLLNFEVVDTGKGFSAGDSERLMQRFSQLGESGSQQHAGSGLGLFLSKQLVEMHGGMLTPSGREGQGARFSFYVVVDAPAPPASEESQASRQQPCSHPNSSLILHSSARGLGGSGGDVGSTHTSQQSAPAPAMSASNQSASPSAPPAPDFQPSAPLPQSDHVKPAVPNSQDNAAPASEVPSSQAGIGGNPESSADQSSGACNQGPFSILILAPLDHTREAIKQHIEQVVPHEVPFTIASQADFDEWKDSVNGDGYSDVTHLVVNLPVEDVLDVMQYISWCDPKSAPTLVIISDLYQKRQIQPRITELLSSGKRIYTVPKPVKPSAFSPIFDPFNRRDLSKDRNQDMAREINDNFKTVLKTVKAVVGNKGHRILLVEDDATNRMVICLPCCIVFVLN